MMASGRAEAAAAACAPQVKDVAHSELLAAQSAGLLVPGQTYRIVDFRTRHVVPRTSEVATGPVEPLVVVATSASQLAATALSASFPQDLIVYELVDTSKAGGDRGRITYRRDQRWGIAMYEDWRHVRYRRWQTATGTGRFWAARPPGLERRIVVAGEGDTLILLHNLVFPIAVGDAFSFGGGPATHRVTALVDGKALGYPGLTAVVSEGSSFPRVAPSREPDAFIEYRYGAGASFKDVAVLGAEDPGSKDIHSIEIGRTTRSPDELTNSVLAPTAAGAAIHDVRCGSNFLNNTNTGNSMVRVAADGEFTDNMFHLNSVQVGFNFQHNIVTETSAIASSRLGTNFMNNVLDFGLLTYVSIIDDFAYNTVTGNPATGQSELTGLNFGEDVFGNHWHSTRFHENALVGGEFSFNRFEKAYVFQNEIGPGFERNLVGGELKNSEIGPNTTEVDFGAGRWDGRALRNGASSFEMVLDASGCRTLDLTPSGARLAGTARVRSTRPTAEIDRILNAPTRFPLQVAPEPGFKLTLKGTPFAALSADGQLLLGAATRVLDGTKRDAVELVRTTVTNGRGTFTVLRERAVQGGL
jgi:hypothetical protein